jgi:hypothetical protein
MRSSARLVVPATGILFFACERAGAADREPPVARPGTATTAATMANVGAVQRISHAVCEREDQCQNVGPQQRWTSYSLCIAEVNSRWTKELNAHQCPGGVDEEALRRCLVELHDQDCWSTLGLPGNVKECAPAEICLETTPDSRQ